MKNLMDVKFFFIICIASAIISAQELELVWEKYINESQWEECRSIIQTSDGGYFLGGCRFKNSNIHGFYCIKMDENGDTLWTRTFNGNTKPDYLDHRCYSVIEAVNGSYVAGGEISEYGSQNLSELFLVNFDENGDTLWTKKIGPEKSECCYSISQTFDGGYILGGSSNSMGSGFTYDMYLVKTDPNGDTIWTKMYGGSEDEKCFAVCQTSDSGYILGGSTDSYGAGYIDMYLVKTNVNGDTMWTKTYGGSSQDVCYSVIQTPDGGYLLAGETVSFGAGYEDICLVKTDSYGNEIWTKTFGGSSIDGCYSIVPTSDGGYVMGGYTMSFSSDLCDMYLIKIDSNCDTIWTETFGKSDKNYCYSVAQTSDNGYILGGSNGYMTINDPGRSDIYLVKTNPSSAVENQATSRLHAGFRTVHTAGSNNIFVTFSQRKEQNVRISMHDMSGAIALNAAHKRFTAGEHTVACNISGCAPGVYVVNITTDDFISSKRVTLLK